MYTEILRIIEGGLNRDPKKVYNYARMLAEKLEKDGDEKMAKMILRAIGTGPATTVTMDELLTTPVDQESRMSIVDVEIPANGDNNVVLPESIENKIDDFIRVIKHQSELRKNGVHMPNTLLLYGAPGSGKTTVARFIAEKMGMPLVIARFDAIVSSLLGNTAKNIRKIFDFADKKPCILFLDEFDAIAKARDDQYELGELKRVINSLLQNIDSFAKENILIAATNHPELLDKAIWRRFNTVIELGFPKEKQIEVMIKSFLNNYDNDFERDERKSERLNKLLIGKSPADIKTIINNAKARAIMANNPLLTYEDMLGEILDFNNHGDVSLEKLVSFLSENGIPQASIAERLNISLRQIRNYLHKED